MSRVRIGRIVGTHGLKGQHLQLPLTDYPERFAGMKHISVYSGDGLFLRGLSVVSVRHAGGKNQLLLQTGELGRVEEAEQLKGTYIEVLPEERVPLEDGEFWIDELKGLTAVKHEDEEPLGTLVDVVRSGDNDLYVIRDASGADHYIPAVSQFIAEVNLEKEQVRISLVEGLW